MTLAKRNRTQALPWHRLEPGTPVLLSAEKKAESEGWRGVVCERRDRTIEIALNEPPEDTERLVSYRLDLCVNEVSGQRQRAALERTHSAQRGRLAELRGILLGEAPPLFLPEQPLKPLENNLNPAQCDAIRFALSAAIWPSSTAHRARARPRRWSN